MSKAKYWKFGDKYAGITARGKRFVADSLSKAKAKIGKTSTTPKSKPKSQSKKRRTTTAKKKVRRRGGNKIFGSVGIKGLLVGIFGMAVAKIGVRMLAPQVPERYIDPVAMIATGAIGKVANLPTKNLLPAGIITGGSTLVADLAGGIIPTIGGAGGIGTRGYDL